MSRFSQALILVSVASSVISISGYLSAACNLQQDTCYFTSACPLPNGCFQQQGAPGHRKVTHRFTEYKCRAVIGTTQENQDCDLDALNNICAVVALYANANDCNASMNSTGSQSLVTKGLCAGSDPCESIAV